jgi:hypothetical protein
MTAGMTYYRSSPPKLRLPFNFPPDVVPAEAEGDVVINAIRGLIARGLDVMKIPDPDPLGPGIDPIGIDDG